MLFKQWINQCDILKWEQVLFFVTLNEITLRSKDADKFVNLCFVDSPSLSLKVYLKTFKNNDFLLDTLSFYHSVLGFIFHLLAFIHGKPTINLNNNKENMIHVWNILVASSEA